MALAPEQVIICNKLHEGGITPQNWPSTISAAPSWINLSWGTHSGGVKALSGDRAVSLYLFQKWIAGGGPRKAGAPGFTQDMALPPVGSMYLDEDGQDCTCIGYTAGEGFVIGEYVSHPGTNGRPTVSVSARGDVRPVPTAEQRAVDHVRGEFPLACEGTIITMLQLGYKLEVVK